MCSHRMVPSSCPLLNWEIDGGVQTNRKKSAFIDHYLKPTLLNIPSLLNNTRELINLLENTPIPPDALLATIDVSNLYLNIPQDEGTKASIETVEKKKTTFPYPRNT